ncbi:MAG: chromosomal replication initiator protein DnaA [Spirochaetes bacterium GWD1_61_31]|nr:MAG: chromosomal replication initiator protein DnaA [Spirochaetes bacterium GWB1_60_80]OHD34270.1 MAG: chromosomal replication initiator protein DnaA [Spirochaetes bacterium GWC1_61_12]OHD40198.1 MAG: chromosomal replication initiator protein DnaA [Spirochaetes bacterium GWD1_61_31]OHD45754.1 MAG: chromosomal replication initiator protein DnaA [Spirochaetes bacterium GWE1_60_18]OHD58299.1 MAG: chromosomal replication initiator protein DnaA [Spirochaetes bacterium GWF1_60_12]HAX37340.1 chrom
MDAWDYSPFWIEAMKQLAEELSEQEFSMWFSIDYDSATQNTINIRVPSAFFRDQLAKNYQARIEKKLYEISGKQLSIDFVVVKPATDENAAKYHSPKTLDSSQDEPRKTNSQSDKNLIAKEPTQPVKHPQMNLNHTFENYVIGENNSFAANAALAIAKNPGKAYNPFLVYGGVGLGKTHLMQAIGNRAFGLNQKLKIICVSAETFTNDFIEALNAQKLSAFKNRYRSVDMLLIDDIHFFDKKESLQEEVFYTFNALYDAGKQMVFTCDRPASELKNLNDRLRSRFERGIKVDLQPPSYEMRFAIIKRKAEGLNTTISDDVIDFIARNISTNIRDIESALTTLVAFTELSNKKIDLKTTEQVLKDSINQIKHSNVTIDHIIRAISDHFRVSSNDLKGKKRNKNIVFPRQVAMFIARDITEYSTTEIGLEFGGRDHTTVMHSCQKTEERLKIDPTLDITIQKIIQVIKDGSKA